MQILMKFMSVVVQVQPCKEKGSVQYLLSGMDWVLDNVKRPAVAQMSLLALGKSYSLNRKVQQLIDANIPFVLSAGNYANGGLASLSRSIELLQGCYISGTAHILQSLGGLIHLPVMLNL